MKNISLSDIIANKEVDVSITKTVLEKIQNSLKEEVITLESFPEIENKQVVALALSRLNKEGVLAKLGKGKYFIPKKTKFGILKPSEGAIIKAILDKSENGYVSGVAAYNNMGLTTQIPSVITIVGDMWNRKTSYGDLRVKFEKSKAPISKKNIGLLQVLDAIRDFKKIPDTNPQNVLMILKEIIKKFSEKEKKEISKLATFYRPYVMAVLGELLEETGFKDTQELKEKLNPLSTFKVGLFGQNMPYKNKWNLV